MIIVPNDDKKNRLRSSKRKEGLSVGDIISKHLLKTKEELVVKVPRISDSEPLRIFFNAIIRENAFIKLNRERGKYENEIWLAKKLNGVEEGSQIFLVGEANGIIIASCSITRGAGKEEHTGALGITIDKNYRHMGIGKILMEEILKLAKEAQMELITLDVVEENKNAIQLYKKLGFVRAGAIPNMFFDGKYHTIITMYKQL